MIIKIALILSVLLQFSASFIAFSLIKRTKFNIAWILISSGFFVMALRRMYEIILILGHGGPNREDIFNSWLAVLVSMLIFFGTVFIRKLFNFQNRIDNIRKTTEAKILSTIIKTEENERQRFAKELHDGLGPILSTIKMTTSAIDKNEITGFNLQLIEKTDFAINQAIASVHEISNNLSPHILKNFGLEKALKSFIDTIIIDKILKIIFNSNLENQRFDYNIEIIIFRIICELITNSIKHSSASKIDINIFKNDEAIEILYSDNGQGFDFEKVKSVSEGMGLSNIETRVKSLNGKSEIFTKINQGFVIKIYIKI